MRVEHRIFPIPLLNFTPVFTGGGGQSANDVSPFDKNLVLAANDTSGSRLSRDGLNHTYVNVLGINHPASRKADGARWSRIVKGRAFITCGDGTSAHGGVYVANNLDDPNSATIWQRLDTATPLVFNGGNVLEAAGPSPASGQYPRHYGHTIEIDESSLSGFTYIHVATVSDGAWRIKMRNSDLTPVEQIQYSGTAGKYIKCLQMATYAPNDSANDYSRIIISQYNSGNPLKPLLCVNANASGANPTLSTAVISSAPTNLEAMGYIFSSGVNMQPVTIFAADGYVGFSTNAFSAPAGSIAINSYTAANGPEASTNWFSVGTTHSGSNYVVLVGTSKGTGSGSSWRTVWRGTWAGTSAAPHNAVTWTALAGSSYWDTHIMGKSGDANLWWLSAEANTPGLSGTAAASCFSTSKTDPSRMYLSAKGMTYMSDDYGLHWYASNVFGSADHSSIMWYQYSHTDTFVTTTGDWPVAVSTNSFATQPVACLPEDSVANCTFEDHKTGDIFIGGAHEGGHGVSPLSSNNTIWKITWSDLNGLQNGTVTPSLSLTTDFTLTTGNVGTDSSTGQPNVGGPMCGACVYPTNGTGTTRVLIVGTMQSGLWYTKNEGSTWAKITSDNAGATDPYTTGSAADNGQMIWDKSRNVLYMMDRSNKAVWRVSVQSNGSISSATQIFRNTWNFALVGDGAGFIDLDIANDRLWVSTLNGVWYITGASTASFATDATTNGTASGFNSRYPGEFAGAMAFLPATGQVVLATVGYASSGAAVYNPSLNGADGPRFLCVSNPTVGSSWAIGTADDWTVSKDRTYRLNMQAPHGIARNFDGTKIALTMQGDGVGVWGII